MSQILSDIFFSWEILNFIKKKQNFRQKILEFHKAT